MTCSVRFRLAVPALLIGLGLTLTAAREARCDPVQEQIDSTRQSIIQGVRDEVQRKINRQNKIDAAGRTEIVSRPVRPRRLKKTPILKE